MKKIINACLLLLLLTGASAHAADVIFDDVLTTSAIGIEDLEVDGIFWDVSFVLPDAPPPPDGEHTLNECNGLFTNTPCDPFLSPGDGAATLSIATTAATAIRDAFNANAQVATSVLDLLTGKTSNVINVPYADALGACDDGPQDPAFCVIRASNLIGSWLINGTGQADLFPGDTAFAMARFTPASSVPVPPAVYLFATGLGLLGSRLKRRRREV